MTKIEMQQFGQTLPFRSGRPLLTWVLIASNVIVFLLMLYAGAGFLGADAQVMVKWGANFGPLTLQGQWWRLFTCTFMHFGIMHLLFNMFVLLQIGPLVEKMLGRLAMLFCYLIAGWGASLASLLWNQQHPVVGAGASGAIFGLYGVAMAFILPRFRTMPPKAFASMCRSLLTFIVLNLVIGASKEGIDVAAHVGGLTTGFAIGMIGGVPVNSGRMGQWIRDGVLMVAGVILVIGTPAITRITPLTDELNQLYRSLYGR